jgi:hypothetical protein
MTVCSGAFFASRGRNGDREIARDRGIGKTDSYLITRKNEIVHPVLFMAFPALC